MQIDPTLQAFWQQAHTVNDSVALTSATLATHLEILHVTGIKPSDRVLAIGVGNGDWVRQLATLATVCVLDIIPEAVEKVADVAPDGWTNPRKICGPFDWALSQWVSPHMDDPDLQLQIGCVVQALAPTGIFALHFNAPLKNRVVDNRCGAHDEVDWLVKAGACRRPGHIAKMAEVVDGCVKEFFTVKVMTACDRVFMVAHIAKAGG